MISMRICVLILVQTLLVEQEQIPGDQPGKHFAVAAYIGRHYVPDIDLQDLAGREMIRLPELHGAPADASQHIVTVAPVQDQFWRIDRVDVRTWFFSQPSVVVI